jgi:hypothetical protein
MTILDLTSINLSDTFEPNVLPAGSEAKLRVINVIEGTSKKGNRFIMPFFECPDDPYFKEFGKYMEIPHAGMEPKVLNKSKLDLVNFFKAFDVDISSEIDLEAIKGAEGWAILGVGKDQDGAPVNTITKFVLAM